MLGVQRIKKLTVRIVLRIIFIFGSAKKKKRRKKKKDETNAAVISGC